jgi:hypothetical protein
MLVIAPKDNLARTFRVAVVIESSRGGAATPTSIENDLAGRILRRGGLIK